jgi:peptide/nickel transport system substrate-binding protein
LVLCFLNNFEITPYIFPYFPLTGEINLNTKAIIPGNWWDILGKPQYGGEMVIRAPRNIVNFDPYYSEKLTSIYGGWMERLVSDDWTLNPAVWDYQIPWHPTRYLKGQLADSWEFPEPGTHVVHLRQGIRWQNIPPANGREFTADDVVFHYHRIYALGGGFTTPSPYRVGIGSGNLISVKSADKYTVVFKLKITNQDAIMENLHGVGQEPCLENPEAVKQWGDVNDWHHAIGTGPFILKDFVSDSHATLVRNPDYWGNDERYPQNKLPYADKLNFLIIPDDAEALEMLRQGQVDLVGGASADEAAAMKKTNPEILQIPIPRPQALTIQPANNKPPFNDIRVRKAMQLAIDLQTIARDYYHGTVAPYPSVITSRDMKGWGYPYEIWPQELKDEYTYNPSLAKKLLADAGYPHGFRTNVVADTSWDMKLLPIVQSYFADIGIDMEIRPMEHNAMLTFVETDRKHELVWREYGPVGHNYSPMSAINRLNSKHEPNWLGIHDPVMDAFYPRALAVTTEEELKPILRDVNERVARQHYVVCLLQPMSYVLYQPWLKGFNSQCHSLSMGMGGPSRLSFYGARFWIDSVLKKRMGK